MSPFKFVAFATSFYFGLVSSQTPDLLGAAIQLWWCDSQDPLQQFTFDKSSGIVRSTMQTNACFTNVDGGAAGRTIQLTACGSRPTDSQIWSESQPYTYTNNGQAWNSQGGDGIEGPNSTISLYTSSELGFNSFFTFLSDGTILANFTSPNNNSFTDLCARALPPPPPITPPIPTQSILNWLSQPVGCFVHFNMATAAGSQGCGGGAPPPIDIWAPTALDTDQWVETCKSMGGTRIIYVAKHGCGFTAWRSNVTLNNYKYTVSNSSYPIVDVVANLVASAKKANIQYGFYYSVVSNAYCNVENGQVQPGPINPALQINVTQVEYEAIVIAHLTELYTAFGTLQEVWFDGGYQKDLQAELQQLFSTLQPNIVAFQGEGLVTSPVRWVGSESGYAPYPCWLTCSYDSYGAGDPNAATMFPAETDFTLQNGDNWFYSSTSGVHSAAELRKMYETSVGHSTSLIIDIAPFPNGTVPDEQVAAAASLGSFVTACYSNPIVQTSGSGQTLISLTPSAAITSDRVLVSEGISHGQLIRSFTITGLQTGGTTVTLATGSAIGANFIQILDPPVSNVNVITLNITSMAQLSPKGAPYVSNFAVFSCSQIAKEADEKWAALGY